MFGSLVTFIFWFVSFQEYRIKVLSINRATLELRIHVFGVFPANPGVQTKFRDIALINGRFIKLFGHSIMKGSAPWSNNGKSLLVYRLAGENPHLPSSG